MKSKKRGATHVLVPTLWTSDVHRVGTSVFKMVSSAVHHCKGKAAVSLYRKLFLFTLRLVNDAYTVLIYALRYNASDSPDKEKQ